MNIVILSSAHPFKTSGIVANDLMNCLNNIGFATQIVTNAKTDQKHSNVTSITSPFKHECRRIKEKISKVFQQKKLIDANYYMASLNIGKSASSAKKVLTKIDIKPDVFIALFPNHFLNENDLFYLSKKTNALVLWYMMDMAALTGGCHYAWDCLGYTKECGCCPGINSSNENDRTHTNILNKINLISKSNIIPVACTEWQYMQLENSSVFKNKPHYKINLPINNSVFKPGNKIEARAQLNISSEKYLIFFGAVSVNEKRKGYKELIESLNLLKTKLKDEEIKKIHLIIAGKNDNRLAEDLPFGHTFLGYLRYDDLAMAFQTADVFVCPSIEDSGPMMINQSIMCGTPVVSFEMGAAIDFIENGSTGYRAPLGSCKDLANGLQKIFLMNSDEKRIMDLNCVDVSSKLMQSNQIAAKFKTVINENIKFA